MISNAVAIICLSKIKKLDLLKKVFGRVIIPNSVKEEVLVVGKGGYGAIKDALSEGWIIAIEPKEKTDYNLGYGENDAINLAVEKKVSIILDDAYAIKVAKALNINILRTTTIAFMAVKKKIISKNEAINILNGLVQIGYFISPKEYTVLLDKLKR